MTPFTLRSPPPIAKSNQDQSKLKDVAAKVTGGSQQSELTNSAIKPSAANPILTPNPQKAFVVVV